MGLSITHAHRLPIPVLPHIKKTNPPPAHILGSEAFRDCVHLETLAIPEGVQEIGDACFAGCETLRAISLPPSLRRIGFRIFEGCGALQHIEVTKGNRIFTTHGPFLLSRNGKSLRSCPTGLAGPLHIPEGIEEIGDWAFHGCINLESLTLPRSLRHIGDGAFSYCTALRELEIPPGVRSIGLYAFRACTQLRRIRLPSGLHELGDYAFERCSSLQIMEFHQPKIRSPQKIPCPAKSLARNATARV